MKRTIALFIKVFYSGSRGAKLSVQPYTGLRKASSLTVVSFWDGYISFALKNPLTKADFFVCPKSFLLSSLGDFLNMQITAPYQRTALAFHPTNQKYRLRRIALLQLAS